MSDTKQPTFEELQGRILDRFHQPVRAVTEQELRQLLDGGLFADVQNFLEYLEQLREIAAGLARVAPATDPEILAMLPITLDRISEWYQRLIEDLPNVVLTPAQGTDPAQAS